MVNEGKVDRIARVVLGIGLLSLSAVGPRSLWGLLGIVPLATGILGFCPMYRLLRLNTTR